jgi:hypothetical protein
MASVHFFFPLSLAFSGLLGRSLAFPMSFDLETALPVPVGETGRGEGTRGPGHPRCTIGGGGAKGSRMMQWSALSSRNQPVAPSGTSSPQLIHHQSFPSTIFFASTPASTACMSESDYIRIFPCPTREQRFPPLWGKQGSGDQVHHSMCCPKMDIDCLMASLAHVRPGLDIGFSTCRFHPTFSLLSPLLLSIVRVSVTPCTNSGLFSPDAAFRFEHGLLMHLI